MNCEECKEQVFELIEREAVDPEGVRAILAECPDCRAEFDAMKVALAAADELPIEEPPGEIDALILRRAELRSQAAAPEEAQVIPFRKRLLQTPPWAMAAIALLAVGVGVWSIRRFGDPAASRAAWVQCLRRTLKPLTRYCALSATAPAARSPLLKAARTQMQ